MSWERNTDAGSKRKQNLMTFLIHSGFGVSVGWSKPIRMVWTGINMAQYSYSASTTASGITFTLFLSFLVLFQNIQMRSVSASGSGGIGNLNLMKDLVSSADGITTNSIKNIKEGVEINIPDNYSIHEAPPTIDGEPTEVEFYVLLVDIRDIDEVKEELTLEFNLQIYWKDSRLSHWGFRQALVQNKTKSKYAVLNPQLIQRVWHPDIFIDRVKKIEQPKVISVPASLRVYYKDGTFRYSGRFNLKLACQMEFQYYPADTQRCKVDIKSYSYSNKTLFINWHERKKPAIKKGVVLPNFALGLGSTENFFLNTSSNVYTGVRFCVILRRHLGFHLIQTYLPSSLFVIVSFLTFLLPYESVLECMTLCMTTLLTLTAMFASVKQNTPTVSYIKGLDIWMVTCIFSVFFTLLEHTVLIKLRQKVFGIPMHSPAIRKKKKKKSMNNENNSDMRSSVFNLNNFGKRILSPKPKSKLASASREPMAPHYHKCTYKCKTPGTGSTGSCSGDDDWSPVLHIRRFSNTNTSAYNGGFHVHPTSRVTTPASRPTTLDVPNNNTLPILTGLRSPTLSPSYNRTVNNQNHSQSSLGYEINHMAMTPSDTLLLSAGLPNAIAITRKTSKRFAFSKHIEQVLSKSIPVSFVLFNCIYWPWLLRSADYYNMNEFMNTNYVD